MFKDTLVLLIPVILMWKIVSHNSIQSFWINIRSNNFQSIDKTFYYFPNANKTVYMVFHLICCNWVKCFLTVFNTFKALGLTMYNFKFYQFPSILDFFVYWSKCDISINGQIQQFMQYADQINYIFDEMSTTSFTDSKQTLS